MITNEDVTKLKRVFATKEDLGVVHIKVDALTERVDGLTEKVADLSVEMSEVHEKMDSMDVKLDKITGMLQDHRQEDAAGTAHLARHDRQIAAPATHTVAAIPN